MRLTGSETQHGSCSSRGHVGKRNGKQNLLLRNEIPLLLMQLDLFRRSVRRPCVQIAESVGRGRSERSPKKAVAVAASTWQNLSGCCSSMYCSRPNRINVCRMTVSANSSPSASAILWSSCDNLGLPAFAEISPARKASVERAQTVGGRS